MFVLVFLCLAVLYRQKPCERPTIRPRSPTNFRKKSFRTSKNCKATTTEKKDVLHTSHSVILASFRPLFIFVFLPQSFLLFLYLFLPPLVLISHVRMPLCDILFYLGMASNTDYATGNKTFRVFISTLKS
jgi:hypothetical protein